MLSRIHINNQNEVRLLDPLLSILIAYALITQGLSLMLDQQLIYQFTPAGAGLWLVIITILAIFASALPALISLR
jgi:hypothetical protein